MARTTWWNIMVEHNGERGIASYTWLPDTIHVLSDALPVSVTASAAWSAMHGLSAALCGFYTELLCAAGSKAARNPAAAVCTILLLLAPLLAPPSHR